MAAITVHWGGVSKRLGSQLGHLNRPRNPSTDPTRRTRRSPTTGSRTWRLVRRLGKFSFKIFRYWSWFINKYQIFHSFCGNSSPSHHTSPAVFRCWSKSFFLSSVFGFQQTIVLPKWLNLLSSKKITSSQQLW